jgi:hypothetical protein
VGLERLPLSLVSTTEKLLGRKTQQTNMTVGIRDGGHAMPSIRKKVGINFADKRQSLG